MGQIQYITREQKVLLDEITQSDLLRSSFYFTGGTALSSVYLHHRYSDDLDFFSEKSIDNQVIFTLMQEWGKKHNYSFQSRFVDVVYIFELMFKNGTNLKVDFAYYPYKRLGKRTNIKNLNVDSLLDVAVNKLLLVSQRSDVKDFVDLYFLLQEFTIWDLVKGVKVKFNTEVDPILLGSDFLKVEDFDYLPRMIRPLDLGVLQSFFREKAKEIGLNSIE